MSRVWFITGSSRGFGALWAEAALRRGDQVVATARSRSTLASLSDEYGDDVLTLDLDVTDRKSVSAAVESAVVRFGRIDIVVNNAGFGLFGAVEEVGEDQVRAQFETNVFGALWVTQAVLPHMRAQSSGHLVQISSIGGIGAFPLLGMYNASKWALEAFSEALAGEVSQFGIRVTLVEPGGYDTDWPGSSAVVAPPMPAYDELREARRYSSPALGDPLATVPALMALVDAPNPPLRLMLGARGPAFVPQLYASRLATWDEWGAVSEAAQKL